MVPEPLSIAIAITALISFLVTVRNATSQLVKDRHAVAHETVNLLRAARRLGTLWSRLLWWRHLWNIRYGIPEALFTAYWGREGQAIKRALEEIISRSDVDIDPEGALAQAGCQAELISTV